MGYATGISANFDNLLNVDFKGFATTNGWTVNDDNWPDHLHLSKGQCFVSLRKQVDNFNDFDGINRNNGHVKCHLGSAYNGAGATPTDRYNTQTNSLVTTVNDTDAILCNDLQDGASNYHFFSGGVGDPDYIYAIFNTNGSNYSHLWLGNLDKLGMSYVNGGAFLSATYFVWWRSQLGHIEAQVDGGGFHRLPFRYTTVANNDHIYAGDASPLEVVRKDNVYGLIPYANTLGGIWSQNAWASGIYALGPSLLNGATPFRALPVAVDVQPLANNFAYQFLGELPNIRLCSMKNRDPGDEVTIGSDTWKLFPFRRVSPHLVIPSEEIPAPPGFINTSWYFGVAIKKII